MRKFYIIVLFTCLGISFSFAQQESQKPIVIKANYFDISPPLRDMIQRSDAVMDQSYKEGVVKNKLNVNMNAGNESEYRGADAVRQATFGNTVTDTTIQNFDGVPSSGFYPPDTDGDVGLAHYMQVVNCRFSIYNKLGVKLAGPTNSSVIFNGLPHNSNDGDAVVLYDVNADRWLFSQFSLPNYPNGPFYENVAISQTGDPTGTWYRFQFTFTDMPDYPKLSVWNDGYYMTCHRFSAGSGNFLSPAVIAMDRSKMLVGDQSATMVMFNMPTSAWGPLPADCNSAFPPDGTPCPVAYLTTASVKMYDFHADFTTPANSTFLQNYTIPIAMFGTLSGNAVPQKGTSQKLDVMAGKKIMFRMPFRKFDDHWSMLLNTTVNVGGVAGIRWMELRNDLAGAWSLYQEGTYAPGDGNYRWMGSIAMDTTGNIALGFSISSSSMYPSIRYTGRMSCDPLGEMTIAEKGIINGGGSQTTSDGRWGDYSAMSADPSEPRKFWYTQEYYSSTSSANWKTRVGSFSLFANNVLADPASVCLGDSTQLSVTPNCGFGTETYTYAWSSIPAGFSSTSQNPKVAPTVTTQYVVAINNGTSIHTDTLLVEVILEPTVSAGADTTVCWYVTSVGVNGTAENVAAVNWTTSGTGTFTNPSTFITSYLPSLADKMAGSVDLNFIGTPMAPCSGNETSTKHVVFDVCTGIDGQNSTGPGLLIQPNPAHGTVAFGIKGINKNSAILSVTTIEGKVLFSETIEASATPALKTLDISGYARGVYFVQLKTGKNVISEKMIVQ
ncbi:MAG: T9SS type A sorting domain-containing protein [Bacteroidetes bacterium]|nr:T9SS type A sorting domain-containing protein [Bacteroidota bacterium]